MKHGLYGLVSLDGAPISQSDAQRLPRGTDAAPGLVLHAEDERGDEIDSVRDGATFTLLLGHITDRAAVARRLGVDPGWGAARIAAAAAARWTADLPAEMPGEWVLLRWDEERRSLALTASDRARDDLYYAVRGGRAVFAPQLARIVAMDWIQDRFDGDAVMRSMAHGPSREGLGDRTFLNGVMRLRPGQTVTISMRGVVVEAARSMEEPAPRDIDFAEAMKEAERLLRQVVRETMAGHEDVAFMLSGGLDSSLLAWIGATERAPGQRVHLLCSSAPEGSGLADESGWAQSVADHFGLELTRVAPGPSADVYQPGARSLAATEAVLGSPRHYLYEALEDSARARGATLLVDGAFGEMSLSNHGFDVRNMRRRLRNVARGVVDVVRPRSNAAESGDPFHVQPSRAALAMLPERPDPSANETRWLRPSDPLGFEPGVEKIMRAVTATTVPGLRTAMPFRDPRLLRMVAALPASFALHDGRPRAMARAILRGNVPDRVANRQSKMPFSPTYASMLRDHARRARERIAAQRDAGADAWLDLDWLDDQLAEMERRGGVPAQAYRIQGTATAAAFLHWWRTERS